jgi:glycosyltransferase involved in cell wall biosynthesis
MKLIHLGLGWIGDQGGGLERYQHGLCSQLAVRGESVEAWVQSRQPQIDDTPYTVIGYASPLEGRSRRLSRLYNLAATRLPSPDALFVSHHASVSEPILNYLRGMPHVVHFHGPWAEESSVEGKSFLRTMLQFRCERRAYRSANHVITLSDAFRKIVIERYGVRSDLVSVVPGGIDMGRSDPKVSRTIAREKLGWPTNRPVILSVRRLIRRVGIDRLIDAVRLLRRQHSEVLVMIAGSGPMRDELDRMVLDYGLKDNVRLLGFMPDEALPLAYAAADFTVVPTQSLEGFGMVLLESLAAGTVPLVTPVGGLPEVCGSFAPESIFDDRTPSAIADRVNQYLSGEIRPPDPESCRRFVRDNYEWGKIAGRIDKIYCAASRSNS